MARKRKKSKSDARPAKGGKKGRAPGDSEHSKEDAAEATPAVAKKKGRSKKTATRKKSSAAADVVAAAESTEELAALGRSDTPDAVTIVDLGAVEDLEVIDLEADQGLEVIRIDDEGDLEVFDLDEDLAADDAVAALLAETMAFVESEEGTAKPPVPPLREESPVVEAEEAQTIKAPRVPVGAELPAEPNPDLAVAMSEMRHAGLTGDLDDDAFDLGEVSGVEDRDRLLAAALAHAEMQEAIYRVPTSTGQTRRWKATIASLIFVLALFVAARPPGFVMPDPPARVSGADELYGIRVTLLIQSQQIEAFRARNLRLPNSMEEVAVQLPGVRLVRSSNRLYQLIAYTRRGEAVVYDSSTPGPEFEGIAREWVTTRGGS
ncbi:MAG: hypothetical protein O2956_14910 [Gemmatimonadetes bacterium]|nr:hypothetical protein [Gemmatimonadota bacterium]